MKITVTATSTSVKDLLTTAWYDLSKINKNKITESNFTNSYWVYIDNISVSSIFIENINTATVTTSKEIKTLTDFSIDVVSLSKLNLICTSGTVDVIIIIA